jgi:ribosomal protein L16 Arg81 hydroxylase
MSSVKKKEETLGLGAIQGFECHDKAESGCAFSRQFWGHFFEHYWGKKPLLIKQPFLTPPVNAADAYQAMVRAASAYRGGYRVRSKGATCIRFMKDNNWVLADIDAYLPTAEDESVAAFVRRLEEQLNGQRFEFTFYDIQEHWPELWLRLREFYSGLYDFTGMPVLPTEPSIFFGNHGKTAKGLHKDDSNNFVFLIEKKRLRFIPKEVFSDKGLDYKTLDYEKYSDDSIILDGEPGDVIYIPADWFHVGETGEGLSLSLSVSFYNYYEPIAEAMDILSRVASKRLPEAARVKTFSFDSSKFRETAENLPEAMSAVVEALKESVQSAEFIRKLQLAQLMRVTGMGFVAPAPMAAKGLSDDEVIVGNSRYPIAWFQLDEQTIACSANGHVFAVPASAEIPELIERLNSNDKYRVKDLVLRHAEGVDPKMLCSFLNKLHSLRAISIAEELPSSPAD